MFWFFSSKMYQKNWQLKNWNCHPNRWTNLLLVMRRFLNYTKFHSSVIDRKCRKLWQPAPSLCPPVMVNHDWSLSIIIDHHQLLFIIADLHQSLTIVIDCHQLLLILINQCLSSSIIVDHCRSLSIIIDHCQLSSVVVVVNFCVDI